MRSKSFKWRSSTIPHGGAALCCFVWLIVTYITSWSTFVTYPRITMPLCIYWMLEQASAAIYLDVAMDRAYSSWQSQRLCKGETRNQGAAARLPSFSKGWALYGALPWAKGSDKKQIWSKGKQIASTVLDSWSVTIALALQVVQTLWLLLTNWQMLTVTPWFLFQVVSRIPWAHGRIFTMGSPMLDRAESLAAEILEAQCVSNEDIDLWETCWPCWQASNFHQFSNSADLRAALHHLKNTEGTCE